MEKDRQGSDISLLDDLITKAGLYKTSNQFLELLDFVTRLRNFAPFNAMLLQIQKPGLRFAASELDWFQRFNRKVKPDARPLLIMWPFCPVALVYDVDDTDGSDLPEDVARAFRTHGDITLEQMKQFTELLLRKNIHIAYHDRGDGHAGNIHIFDKSKDEKDKDILSYAIALNKNHEIPVQFSTLAHELGHLFLGHLGKDKRLKVPMRNGLTHSQVEIEAESVAYLVCKRNGIEPDSAKYLSQFGENAVLERMDIYQIMRAAGQVEQVLGLGSKTQFEKSGEHGKQLSLSLD